ncbi:hypothetical protein J6590_017453 [Homalodisca vitripennis]|nr:hypothetical protein J6590_017453 [Homalodisca vitripennis]
MVDDVLLEENESTKFLRMYFDRGLTTHYTASVSSKVGSDTLRKLAKFCSTCNEDVRTACGELMYNADMSRLVMSPVRVTTCYRPIVTTTAELSR